MFECSENMSSNNPILNPQSPHGDIPVDIVTMAGVSVLFQSRNGDVAALTDIVIRVSQGDFVSIIGPSGAGKSTLLRCMNLLVAPSAGSVSFRGVDTRQLTASSRRNIRRQTGMIFQRHQLLAQFTVRQNVAMGLFGKYSFWRSAVGFLQGRFDDKDEQAIDAVLRELGIYEKQHQRVDQLSGGQQQRVAIARAMVQSPVLLLADEPIASLDEGRATDVMQNLRELNRKGLTVVCNLHDVEIAKRYSSRIIALRHGKVLFDGVPDALSQEIREQIFAL